VALKPEPSILAPTARDQEHPVMVFDYTKTPERVGSGLLKARMFQKGCFSPPMSRRRGEAASAVVAEIESSTIVWVLLIAHNGTENSAAQSSKGAEHDIAEGS
jgi:hypothetical protein